MVVPAVRRKDVRYDLADFIDPRNAVDGLGVFMVDLDERLLSPLAITRKPSGVVVIARSSGLNTYTSELLPGDIVYEINQQTVESVQQVRSALQPMKPGQSVVLQIERGSQLQYVAFEWGD